MPGIHVKADLKINNIFGPTIQGEGAAAGRHCLFIRTAHCNLECSFCDTAQTWAYSEEKAGKHRDGIEYDKTEQVKQMSVVDVLTELNKLWAIRQHPTLIVVSGGEPLMQGKYLAPLVKSLHNMGHSIHVETAGTLMPHADFDHQVEQYNVSPKLSNSGNALRKRYKPSVLEFFANDTRAWFKFVVTGTQDLKEIDDLVNHHNIIRNRVMIMPEGITAEATLKHGQDVARHVITRGYGISLRSHILLGLD
jgi:7-carboxy-7-deazaguanine synthase